MKKIIIMLLACFVFVSGFVSATCTDSDGGINIYKAGEVVWDTGVSANPNLQVLHYPDQCGDKMVEYYCTEDGKAESSVQECPQGFKCYNDACVKSEEDSCTKYYTCPDGTKVKQCEIASNGMCDCKAVNCPSTASGGSGGGASEVTGITSSVANPVAVSEPTNSIATTSSASGGASQPTQVAQAICEKVCKGIGTKSEGWYDSCTGEIIQYTNCGETSICNSCEDGLIGYWKLDEESGDVIFDSSGNNHNGQIKGKVTRTSGKSGGSFEFNGGFDDESGIQTGLKDIGNTYSVNVWIKKSTPPEIEKWRVIVTKTDIQNWNSNYDTTPIELVYGDGRSGGSGASAVRFTIWDHGRGVLGLVNTDYNLQDGNWHMITATYRKGEQNLYYDGKLVATASYSGILPVTSEPFSIGRGWLTAGRDIYHPGATGAIDEVSIWNRVLSESEVSSLYSESTIPYEDVDENVKCIFKNSDKEQKCYAAIDNMVGCSGKESCIVSVTYQKGKRVVWKSSCGGYQYSLQDGIEEYIEFDCTIGQTNVVEINNKGFQYAYWQCYDGLEEKQGTKSCTSSAEWQKKAKYFCEGHCINKDKQEKCKGDENCILKCGVNSFAVSGECYGEEATPVSAIAEVAPIAVATETKQVEPILPQDVVVCKDSCPLDSKCYLFGYRKANKYCSDDGKFIEQLGGEASCENNFECKSNLCVDGKCISKGFLEKVMNWFKRMFGAKE